MKQNKGFSLHHEMQKTAKMKLQKWLSKHSGNSFTGQTSSDWWKSCFQAVFLCNNKKNFNLMSNCAWRNICTYTCAFFNGMGSMSNSEMSNN